MLKIRLDFKIHLMLIMFMPLMVCVRIVKLNVVKNYVCQVNCAVFYCNSRNLFKSGNVESLAVTYGNSETQILNRNLDHFLWRKTIFCKMRNRMQITNIITDLTFTERNISELNSISKFVLLQCMKQKVIFTLYN